jgi:hypothetical protein
MLDQNSIQTQLIAWMQEFVETPNSALGAWAPCPYARAARINNQIEILFSEPSDLYVDVMASVACLEHKEVVVICFDHHQLGAVELQELVQNINQNLMPNNYVILEDHPDAPEYVSGVRMNFGACGLLIVQKLDRLNTASAQLKQKGYYDHWNKEAIDAVVTWRNQ